MQHFIREWTIDIKIIKYNLCITIYCASFYMNAIIGCCYDCVSYLKKKKNGKYHAMTIIHWLRISRFHNKYLKKNDFCCMFLLLLHLACANEHCTMYILKVGLWRQFYRTFVNCQLLILSIYFFTNVPAIQSVLCFQVEFNFFLWNLYQNEMNCIWNGWIKQFQSIVEHFSNFIICFRRRKRRIKH